MADFAIKTDNITKIFHKTHKKSFFTGLTHGLFSHKKKELLEELVVAVDDISFELKKGEALGIIGNNGSGKSTLLKILCGITKPTSGKVFIDGEISALLDMGIALVPELTGNENVFIYGELQGLSPVKIKQMYSSIVEFSELGDYIDTPVKYYSSGMMMRLAFSVMAHSDKDILLFDEVFAVGDIFFRTKCQKWLNALRNNNKSIILVSHSMNEVANFCDYLILLDKGKIIASGNTGKVVKIYNEFNSKNSINKQERDIQLNSVKKIAKHNIINEMKWSESEVIGDNHCKISSSHIIRTNGTDKNGQEINLKICVSITDFSGDVGFVISDILENRIICDLARHHIKEESVIFPNGIFDLTWSLPQHLLNNGTYKVSLIIIDSEKQVQYRALNVISFYIEHKNDPEKLFIFPMRTEHDFSISEHK